MRKNIKLLSIILIVLAILVIPINSFALSGIYDVQNELNGRYLDTAGDGVTVVTNPYRGNAAQLWEFIPISDYTDTYRIKQPASGRYLDAYDYGTYKAVVQTKQDNTSQWWVVTPSYFGHYRIRQYYPTRYLDIDSSISYVFTSLYANESSQRWIID